MVELSLIRMVARLAPLLAPIPSAYFIGRAIYYHLLYQWHIDTPAWVGLTVAILAGLAIELLAISSVYLLTNLHRWNQQGRVRKAGGWEKAPAWAAALVAMMYLAVAIYLLVVLEAVPDLARFSAIAFPVLAGVGAINWALFQQHQDRLDRYGLKWSFKAKPAEAGEPKPEPVQVPKPKVPVYKPDTLDKAIMAAYQADPGLSYSGVAETIEASKSTVGSRVLKLRQANLMTWTDDGAKILWSGNGTS